MIQIKKKTQVITLLMVIMAILNGCQPTPEKEIVVGKSEEQIQEMIDSAEENSTYESEGDVQDNYEPILSDYQAPERLEYVITSNFEGGAEMEIRVNADVIIPKYTLPMYKIVHTDIPFENLQSAINLLSEGRTLYRSKYAARATLKADIQSQIDRYNLELKYAEDGESKEFYKGRIAELLVEYENAPATYEEAGIVADDINDNTQAVETAEGEIIYFTSDGRQLLTEEEIGPFILDDNTYKESQQLVMGQEQGDPRNLLFNGTRLESVMTIGGNYPYIMYVKQNIECDYDYASIFTTQRDLGELNLSMTLEQAIDIAMPYVNAIDESLELVDTAAADIIKNNDDCEAEHIDYGYTLYFSRKYNGIEMNYADGDSYYSDMIEDQERQQLSSGEVMYGNNSYPQELLKVIVGPNGVQQLNYQSPTEIVEHISNDVELLPFDEIEAKFKEYIRYNGWDNGKIYMDINSIELNLMAIQQPDSDEYLVIPVWDFYGGAVLSSDTTYFSDEEYWNEKIFYHYGRCFLTINAINGSIINRPEGNRVLG